MTGQETFYEFINVTKQDKAKLVERQGRKATGLNRQPGYLEKGSSAFCIGTFSKQPSL
jgi:hypothetical protein